MRVRWRHVFALSAIGPLLLLPTTGAWAQTVSGSSLVAETRSLFQLPKSVPVTVSSGGGPGTSIQVGSSMVFPGFVNYSGSGRIAMASDLPPVVSGQTPSLVSLAAAGKTAAALAQRVAGSELPSTQAVGPLLTAPLQAEWKWRRQVNGLPVLGQGVSVQVSLLSGRVVGMSRTWQTPTSWPSPTPAHSASWLDARLLSSGSLIPYYTQTGTPVVGLFSPGMGPAMQVALSARTGQPVGMGMYGMPATPSAPISVSFNPAGTPFAYPQNAVTEAQAHQIAASFVQSVGITAPLSGSVGGFSSSGPNGSMTQSGWTFQFGSAQGKGLQGTIGVDQNTGLVVNFQEFSAGSLMMMPPSGTPTPPSASQVAAAQHFLASLPLPAGDRFLSAGGGGFGPGGGTMLQFLPVGSNGVPVSAPVMIEVNSKGQVIDFSLQPLPKLAAFPANFSLTAASTAWLKAYPLSLAYELSTPADPFLPTSTTPPTAHLVYTVSGSGLLSAATLQPTALPYMSSFQTVPAPQQVGGRGVLATLQEAGAVPAAVYDNTPVQRGAASRFLLTLQSATGLYPPNPSSQGGMMVGTPGLLNGSPDALLQGTANGAGLDAGATLTRQEAAVLVLRLLGYAHISSLGGSVRLPYRDANRIAPWARGAVGIATGLGLFKGQPGGAFGPDIPMTWSQLAIVGQRLLPVLVQRS